VNRAPSALRPRGLFRRRSHLERALNSTEFDTENHPALQVVKKGEIVWLGVRDDFRSWLIRAA